MVEDRIKKLSIKIENSHLREVFSPGMFNGVQTCKDCAFYEGKDKLTDGMDYGGCSRWQPLGKHAVFWFMRCDEFIERSATLPKGPMMSPHNRETLFQAGRAMGCKECGRPGMLMLHYNDPTGDKNRPADGYYVMHPPDRNCSVWNLHRLQPATAIHSQAKEAIEEWNEKFGRKPETKPTPTCGNCRFHGEPVDAMNNTTCQRNPPSVWDPKTYRYVYPIVDARKPCGEHEYKEKNT